MSPKQLVCKTNELITYCVEGKSYFDSCVSVSQKRKGKVGILIVI